MEQESLSLLKAVKMIHVRGGNWATEIMEFTARFIRTYTMLGEDLEDRRELFTENMKEPLQSFAMDKAKLCKKLFENLLDSYISWSEDMTKSDRASEIMATVAPPVFSTTTTISSAAPSASGKAGATNKGPGISRKTMLFKPPRIGIISVEQRQLCIAAGLCFKYGKHRHAASACKKVFDLTKPRVGSDNVCKLLELPLKSAVRTVGKWQPLTPPGGTTPISIVIAVFAMEVKKIAKLINKAECWNTIKFPELRVKHFKLKILQPIQGVNMKNRVDAVKAWVLEKFNSLPDASLVVMSGNVVFSLDKRTVKVVVRKITNLNKHIHIWIDSGLRTNLISEDYACFLQLKVIKGPEKVAIISFNQAELGRSRRFVVVSMDFEEEKAESK